MYLIPPGAAFWRLLRAGGAAIWNVVVGFVGAAVDQIKHVGGRHGR
jgi:hypothetical protein